MVNLPEPSIQASTLVHKGSLFGPLFSTEQMKAYGQQCREAGLEDAASICDGEKWFNDKRPVPYIKAFNEGCEECQLAIRRLK